MNDLGLKKEIILEINSKINNYSNIQKATVFGSRAMGNHKQYSDVDIAIFGNLNDLELESLRLDLDELYIIYKLDLVEYDRISNLELKEHIDRVGVEIYNRNGAEEGI